MIKGGDYIIIITHIFYIKKLNNSSNLSLNYFVRQNKYVSKKMAVFFYGYYLEYK